MARRKQRRVTGLEQALADLSWQDREGIDLVVQMIQGVTGREIETARELAKRAKALAQVAKLFEVAAEALDEGDLEMVAKMSDKVLDKWERLAD